MVKTILSLLVIMQLSCNLLAQSPRLLLNQVQTKLNKAANYKADINIKVDLPYIS
jgi:hypothetical protein